MAAIDVTARIAIIGAGIGGLTAALALKRQGFTNVVVLEQAARLREVGAGIQVTPNASRLLHKLGLEAALRKVVVLPFALQARDYRSGRMIRNFPLGDTSLRRYGSPHYHIHRADLHSSILASLGEEAVQVDSRCIAIDQDSDGVTITLENGRTERAAIAVGADGIHSRIRAALFGADSPRFSGLVAWRGLAPADRLKDLRLKHTTSSFWGPGRHFVSYFVSSGTLVNWVGVVPATEARAESWSARGDKAEILNEYQGWHAIVRRIIEATDAPFVWGLYDRDPMPCWSKGRITLLGDAAHAMLPFMSQGAAQAIEDGYVLAQCLGKMGAGPVEALASYENLRRERTKWVQLGSRANGRTFHVASPAAKLARYVRFRIASFNPRSAERQKLDRLYGHDCDRHQLEGAGR